jgi:hypothetical protein
LELVLNRSPSSQHLRPEGTHWQLNPRDSRRLPMAVKSGIGFAFETCHLGTDRYSAKPIEREVVVIGTSSNEISLSAQELPNCQLMPKVSVRRANLA